MLITTKLPHLVPSTSSTIFAERSWRFWSQELENVWLFRHCTKSQVFSIYCAQNHHDLLAKIVKEVDGTKRGELCCYKHWALVLITVYSQNNLDPIVCLADSFWIPYTLCYLRDPTGVDSFHFLFSPIHFSHAAFLILHHFSLDCNVTQQAQPFSLFVTEHTGFFYDFNIEE